MYEIIKVSCYENSDERSTVLWCVHYVTAVKKNKQKLETWNISVISDKKCCENYSDC